MNNQYNFNLDFNPNNFFSSTDRNNLPDGHMGCEILEKNKDLVQKMYDKRNDHLTADESYMNMVNIYNFSIFKSMNLSVGIIASMVFIYYHK